jgi:hypothetical protein
VLVTFSRAFAFEAVVLLVFALWFRRRLLPGGVDLYVHGTFFVLSSTSVCFLLATFLCLFAAAYSVFPINTRATVWHFWLTTIALAVFWVSFCFWAYISREGTVVSRGSSLELAIASIFVVSILVLLISPALFVVNVTLALARSHAAMR